MTGKMSAALLGMLGRSLAGGGVKNAASALVTTGMAAGGKGMGRGRRSLMRGKSDDASLLEKALDSLLEDSHHKTRPKSLHDRALSAPGEGIPPLHELSQKDTDAARNALVRHIVSFTDGRVRLRHKALMNASVHAPLAGALEKDGRLESVRFNASTGSVLLLYDAALMSREGFLEVALPLGAFLAAY